MRRTPRHAYTRARHRAPSAVLAMVHTNRLYPAVLIAVYAALQFGLQH